MDTATSKVRPPLLIPLARYSVPFLVPIDYFKSLNSPRMIISISIVTTLLLLLTALVAQHGKGFCLKTHSQTEAAQRKALSPASCSACGDPPRSCPSWQMLGSELVLSPPPTSEQLQREKPLLPLVQPSPVVARGGSSGHVFPLSLS